MHAVWLPGMCRQMLNAGACLEGDAGPAPRVVTLLCQVIHHEQLVFVACIEDTGTADNPD